MTLIAGIISRNSKSPVPSAVCDYLKRSISRNSSDEVIVHKDNSHFIIKVDIGAYDERAFKLDKGGALTLVAGEPLLNFNNDGNRQSRQQDTDSIHGEFVNDNYDILKKAEGIFCAVHYQPANGKISLIADKLCLRPLYFWVNDKYVIFASALRILENIAEIPKQMDVRGITEIVGLGYPLGDRTPYKNIFLLKAAEIVQITENEISRRHYWHWDEIKVSADSEENLLSELYQQFKNAVARRIGNDKTTLAYLSGGLDSRCVVAALRSQNVNVHTFNFSRPNTQDQLFGLEFARKADTIHEEVSKEQGNLVPDYSSLMAQTWNASKNREKFPVERPALVWNGEGGSVALGHVHLSEKIVDFMRRGQIDAAIKEYLERETIYVPSKLFQPQFFASISKVIEDGIREELGNLNCEDAARNFYFYLMLNDQRRKLADHFENIDLHRLELQSPFLDGAFLSSIAAIPVDLCLKHKFYVEWLKLFQTAVTSVPWQAYPGHEPCPLPVPKDLAYQWSQKYQNAENKTKKRKLMKQAAEILRKDDFPEKILSRKNLQMVKIIHSTGWRNYDYVIEAAQIYYKYWEKCGEYILPEN